MSELESLSSPQGGLKVQVQCQGFYVRLALRAFTVVSLLYGLNVPFAQAQSGAPVPPMPVQNNSQIVAPVPGGPVPVISGKLVAPSTGRGGYQQLPLNANDAQMRVDELRVLLPGAKPQDIQESIYQLCEWLQEIADGHYRLANSFAKHDSTKLQAEAERRLTRVFSQLKNQAQLLKADLLIKQQRYPEALAPLVEIVSNEPKSQTGQAAYKRLKDIGFSEEVERKVEQVVPLNLPENEGKGNQKIASPQVGSTSSLADVPGDKDVNKQTNSIVQPPTVGKSQEQASHPTSGKLPLKSAATGARVERPPSLWLSGTPAGRPIKSDGLNSGIGGRY